MAMAWGIGAVFACAHAAGGQASTVGVHWIVVYFVALFLMQTGAFARADELRLERSNVERVEVDGARVSLRVHGLFQKQAVSVDFVVSRAECPTLFNRFEQVFPGLLPKAYAETARRTEHFQQVNAAIG